MDKAISHHREEESPKAKARWFQDLTVSERADLLCQFTDMIFVINPRIVERKYAQPVEGRILVVSKT